MSRPTRCSHRWWRRPVCLRSDGAPRDPPPPTHEPSRSVRKMACPRNAGSSAAGLVSRGCAYRPALLACQIMTIADRMGAPEIVRTVPMTSIAPLSSLLQPRRRAIRVADGFRKMEIFIQQLVNSLSVASVTILIGIGITLIFGLAGIVNFAHGEFLMIGGMITWFLVTSGLNFFIALVGAMIFVGVLGFAAERGLFRFTLHRPMNGFIMSIGVSVILQHVVIRVFNEVQKTIPDPIGKVWVVGGVSIIAMRAVVVVLTAAVVVITYFGISRSRYHEESERKTPPAPTSRHSSPQRVTT